MQILVIGHGESEDETINVHEPLTSRGIAQSKKMSIRISEQFPPEIAPLTWTNHKKVVAIYILEPYHPVGKRIIWLSFFATGLESY